MKNINHRSRLCSILLSILALSVSAAAQTTVFIYQGKLTDSGMPQAVYQMQFRLFDSVAGGTQLGATLTNNNVSVSQGVFTVNLDYGVSAFPGADRFLEIAVRRNAGETFVTLNPRNQINSSPYSIRTLSAAQADIALDSNSLGGVAANQYLQTNGNGSGLTNLNAGNITTGTLNNARLGQIPTANIADSAVTSAKIAGGQVVKSVNTLRDDVTLAAGTNITITPAGNTLTIASTSGGVGGSGTTNPNTIPLWTGGTTLGNSLITQSGGTVQMPSEVSLAATASGKNVAFGSPNGETGLSISSPDGPRADLRFGPGPMGPSSPTLKLAVRPAGSGPPASTNGIAITTEGRVGVGTEIPGSRFTVFGTAVGSCGPAHIGWGGPVSRGCISALAVSTDDPNRNLIEGLNSKGRVFLVTGSGDVGIRTINPQDALDVNGNIRIGLGMGGDQPMCRGSVSRQVATCGSSLRYKTAIKPFRGGLDLINRLRPISFTWKSSGAVDLGLGAEDVSEVEPLLVTRNDKGEVEGVKYDRIGVVLVNAVKEQQAQIEIQRNLIEKLERRLEELEIKLREKHRQP